MSHRFVSRLRGCVATATLLAVALAPGGAGATKLYFDSGYQHSRKADLHGSDPTAPPPPPVPVRYLGATDLVNAAHSVDAHGCMAGQVGVPMNFSMAKAHPAPAGTVYAFRSDPYGGHQPPVPGLAMAQDGTVTGTPKEARAGAFGYEAAGVNGSGYDVMDNQCYQVGLPAEASSALAIDSLRYSPQVDQGTYLDLSAPNVTGAVGRVTWSVSPQPPAGVTFADGRLSGIPTAEGTYGYTITVRDSTGASASTDATNLKVVTAAFAPILSSTGCIDTTKHEPVDWDGWSWEHKPTATLSWSGILPEGLTIDSGSGRITGTPVDNYSNDAGTSGAFITAYWTDASGSHSASGSPCFDPKAPQPLSVGSGTDVVYNVGEQVEQTGPTIEGGSGDVTWSVYPDLPEGLTLGDDGSISGSLNYPLSIYYTVTATDSKGITGSAYGSITVLDDAPTIAFDGTCVTASAGSGLTPAFPWIIHNPTGQAVTWALASSSSTGAGQGHGLGEFMAVDQATGLVTANVPASVGTSAYDFNFAVTASWFDDQGAGQQFTVNACARFNHAGA